MDLGLSGKVALVAGASRGLGFAVAQALAREGARVSIASREDAAVRGAAQRIGGDVLATPLDVRSADGIQHWTAVTADKYGGIDLLFTPTTPGPAFRAGDRLEDPVAMYLADVFVCPVNLAGLPAVSIPVGRSGGLPVGAQFIAPPLRDSRMLSAAALLESALDATAEVQ